MAKTSFLLYLSVLVGFAAAIDYTNNMELDGENYKLWWTYNNKTEIFNFKVEVAAKGWIGFGFTLLESQSWMRGAMRKYDVMVAGVFPNGTGYSQDYLTSYLNISQYPDHVDAKNNWEVTKAEESNGKTILEFNRKRKTDDTMTNAVPLKGDIEITPGVRNFVWAYHDKKDTPYLDDISLKHTKSGLKKVELIKEDVKEPIHISYPPKGDRYSKASGISTISAVTFFMGTLLTVLTVYAF